MQINTLKKRLDPRALFGLLYILGAMCMSHTTMEHFYSIDGTGVYILLTTKSIKATKFLLTRCDLMIQLHEHLVIFWIGLLRTAYNLIKIKNTY